MATSPVGPAESAGQIVHGADGERREQSSDVVPVADARDRPVRGGLCVTIEA